MERKVVVTGIGPVTPVGTGRDAFWDALVAGRSGIAEVTLFDASEFPVRIAGEVKDFDPSTWMEPKAVKRTDRVVHLAVAAAKLAWEDAGQPRTDPQRAAVVMSTGVGGLQYMEDQIRILASRGPGRVSAFTVPAMMPNAAAGTIAMELGFTGPNACITTACAAGAHGIGEGYRYIKHGMADICLAGGTEAGVTPLAMAAFAQMQALTRNPDPLQASRPFDADRDGFVMAEAACVLVLEEEEHARARGATIYAEVAGYGTSADAYHITAPEPQGTGAVIAMQMALTDAEEAAEAVDYVNAHGTSTPLNDAAETRAIKKALGDHAYNVAVSSTKSMTGHMVGAAGAAEGAVIALAIDRGVIPPTTNYETADPECDLDYVPNEARTADVRLALSNSFGFGGQNAVVAFRKP
ncbi:MAG TPA: beta-ketoacyl-ACP synthase II [Actinomycetota bacterium]|nr:beta-ketoacyl-ACP synthase II [Actinomycetota bacterium]